MEEREIITDIGVLKNDWVTRNRKFREWYDMLTLKDNLKQEGLESVCANDPRTLYNLGHYLMTAGELHHIIPVSVDSPIELEKQAKCERALEYLWRGVDRKMSISLFLPLGGMLELLALMTQSKKALLCFGILLIRTQDILIMKW